MRLVDAGALLKHFETIQKQENAIGLDFVAIADEIKDYPTAYDPDKVVQQIKELSIRERGEIRTEDVITIVKGGGVDVD